jgi:hypothetical protein
VHGEDEDGRTLIMQTQAADEGEHAQRAGAHGKVDDDHVGALHAVKTEAIGQALRLHDMLDAASSSSCRYPSSTMG